MREYPDELTADFQQTYGIDLSGYFATHEPAYRLTHIAALATQLPYTSRVYTKMNPDLAWTNDTRILADIANSLRALLASLGGGGEPDFILPPSMMEERNKAHKLDAMVMDREELDRILKMKRGE